MVKTVGPAVGSKGQIAYKEESKWGYPCSPPDQFMEFTSEGVASEFTNLVSASLRSDRAVHKQRTGTETAGGDVNMEFGPEGIGTWVKHALGQRLTKRLDTAFILVYNGASTNVYLMCDGSSMHSVGASQALNVTFSNGRTITNIIAQINTLSDWEAYAPWGDGTNGYYPSATKTAASKLYGAADFDGTGTPATTAGGVQNLETFPHVPVPISEADHRTFIPIYFKYGIYQHTIKAYPDLPPGMTLEIGRDVAAFNYYGCKVNSMAMTLNPGEISTATFNVMAKGASTCGDPAVVGTNTGWATPFTSLRYAGSQANAYITLTTDGSRDGITFEQGAAGTESWYWIPFARGTCSHDGYYFDTTTLKGLMEFLDYTDLFSITRKAGFDYSMASTNLLDIVRTQLLPTADMEFNIATSTSIMPLFRGNYIGTDLGESITVYADITTAGSTDGSAAFKGSTNNSTWSTAQTIRYGVWYNINDQNNVDTGFDIMFPEIVTLPANDTWSITSFKDEKTGAVFATPDPFTGFQGALTIDGATLGVMSMNFTLNNNLYGDKFELGDRQRAALIEQRRTTEGTINMEFDNLDMYRRFVNGTPGNLVVVLTSDQYVDALHSTKYSMTIRFPNIKFSGSTPVIGGMEIITTDFPFTALYDDVTPLPELVITLVNGQPYV